MELKGTVTALVTPFRNGELDLASLRRLVEYQVSSGVQGLLACGCTGEPATLTDEEKFRVVETVLDSAGDGITVIAGTGTNSTAGTVEFTRRMSGTGVHAVLVITPYYNKPTAEGQLAHYTRVAEASRKPVIIYNVPGRTGTCMEIETLARLGDHPNIIGVKDAAGSVDRVTELAALSDLAFISGDDHLALPQVLMGAHGVISVTSNAAPARMARMIEAGLAGRVQEARNLHRELHPLFTAMFLETNPGPVKKALELLEIIEDGSPRLPLVSASEDTSLTLDAVMRELELL